LGVVMLSTFGYEQRGSLVIEFESGLSSYKNKVANEFKRCDIRNVWVFHSSSK